MSKSTSSNLWLIGSGRMAQEYVQVLKSLQTPFKVIGRGEKSASALENAMKIPVQTGGIEMALQKEQPMDTAIVAVGVDQLASVSSKLLQAGTKRILLEKPGGMNLEELQKIQSEAKSKQAEVRLAYNRRFFESTLRAKEIIQKDGGVTSCHFEFTEWSHKIRNLDSKKDIKAIWLLANSTHVVDLAFHLCGWPSSFQSWSAGSLDWHPAAARFAGAGVTEQGVLFSYFADWEAPGRWGVEVLTRNNRLILRPMEQLQLLPLGSLQVETVNLNNKFDHDFKPGLYRQTEAFLNGDTDDICSLQEQVEHTKLYSEIASYGN